MMRITLLQSRVLMAIGLYSSFSCFAFTKTLKWDFNNAGSISCNATGQHCVAVSLDNVQGVYISPRVYTNDGDNTRIATLEYPKTRLDDATDYIKPFQVQALASAYPMQIKCDQTATHCLISGIVPGSKSPIALTYTSHDGGYTWSQPNKIRFENQPSVRDFAKRSQSLECDTDMKTCILMNNMVSESAITPIFFTTQDGGDTWSAGTVFNTSDPYGEHVTDLRCDSSGFICSAISYTAADTIDDYIQPKPVHNESFADRGTHIYSTQDGGHTWFGGRQLQLFTQNSQIDDATHPDEKKSFDWDVISCDASGLNCLALGEYSQGLDLGNSHDNRPGEYAYSTKDGGVSWQEISKIGEDYHYPRFHHMHCDSTNHSCVASGFMTEYTTRHKNDRLDGWTRNLNNMPAVVYTSIDDGRTWKKQSFWIDTSKTLIRDIFCTEDISLCHAVASLIEQPQGKRI